MGPSEALLNAFTRPVLARTHRCACAPGKVLVAPRDRSLNRNVVCLAKKNLDLEDVTEIIRMVNSTDIVEFELKQKGINLAVRKQEALNPQVAVAAAPAVSLVPAPAPAAAAPPPPTAAPAAAPPAPPKPASSNGAPDGLEISSPMSGTYYSSPAPGEPQFVKVGDKVIAGQTVCIIEAMKLMNEIEAEVGGEVLSVLKSNGDNISAGDMYFKGIEQEMVREEFKQNA